MLTQIAGFLAAIVVVASEDRWHEPWSQVTALGVLAERTPSPSDTLEGPTFVLLAWAANQVPL